ncbi:uncharacterized protein [Solanum tuberosum]|uniref:uncharacterized protein n=1 Tax=Solanum tuberosum TaxID=4113 RepID=UPI00073A30D4|nr:PREDICTED: uncharacterized protein LOC107061829 [Solanum tuberosum]
MNSETSFLTPPVFNGENYQAWEIRMMVHLEALDLCEAETIKDYADKLLDLANKVRLFGKDFTDERIVQKILVTLPEKYEATIFSLENSKDLSSVTLAELVKGLQALEQRRLIGKQGSVEGAFQANSLNNKSNKGRKKNKTQRPSINYNKHGGSQPPCPHCKKTNHSQQKCWWRPDVKCNKCGQLGHVERVCKSQPQQEESKAAVNQYQEEQLFVATCFASKNASKSWLIDSGCINHMTSNQELFKDLDRYFISKVKIGNGEYLDARGRGTVAIESLTAIIKLENNSELWHKRLRHFHHDAILFMKENKLAKGLPSLEKNLSACEACQYGKQARLPFQNSSWRAKQNLQLIHTDVGGPQKSPSLKGSKYYIAFIDDCTRYCWIYVLNYKFEVADVFWKYKAFVENQSGCRIQVIRSDNGTEYTSEKFNKFCNEAGIEHQLTTPYTPQQNGVVERKNRTLMEMTRCLLHEKGLPKKFWAEAANTAIFLLNRLPTKALQKKTPFEAWFGYSSLSKAYRIYQPQNDKIIVRRDVKFVENDTWSWQNDEKQKNLESLDEDIDDIPIRGTRALSDIYQRCNIAILEPGGFMEAAKDEK